jgi:hypothetical protein
VEWVALSLAIFIIAAIIAAIVLPLRFELTVKGHGEFGKFWALGMGGQVAFVTATLAVAHGIDGILQVHVFGRRVVHISPLVSLIRKAEEEPTILLERVIKEKLPKWRGRIERWFDLLDLLELLLDMRRYIQLERLDGRLAYATPDVAVTGMISGSLFTLAGLMAPFGTFYVEPQWIDVAKANGNLNVVVRVYPVRMVLRVVAFTVWHVRLLPVNAKEAPSKVATPQGQADSTR